MAVCERSKQRAKHTLTRNCCAVIAVMIVFGTAGCGAQKPAVSLPRKLEPAAVTTPAPKAMPRPTEAPKETELVFTGRNAPDWLMDRADLVTEMREVKHYYQKGVEARKGIEN